MTIVTASVDSIVLLKELKYNKKVRVRGRPIYVGNSSIECQLVVDQLKESSYEVILNSFFTMVALNKETNKPMQVNRLNPVTDEDKNLFELGKRLKFFFLIFKIFCEERKIEKKEKSASHLFIHPPYTDEIRLLHEKFIEILKLEKTQKTNSILENKKFVTPEDTRIENNLWMVNQHLTLFKFFRIASSI